MPIQGTTATIVNDTYFVPSQDEHYWTNQQREPETLILKENGQVTTAGEKLNSALNNPKVESCAFTIGGLGSNTEYPTGFSIQSSVQGGANLNFNHEGTKLNVPGGASNQKTVINLLG